MALDLIVQHVHSQLEKVSWGEEEKGPAGRMWLHTDLCSRPLSSQKALTWCLGEQICEVGTGEEGGEPPGLLW